MAEIRLIPEGGSLTSDGIEDLDVDHVPVAGDVIELNYGAGDKRTYQVLRRRFHIFVASQFAEVRKERIAVEVRQIR